MAATATQQIIANSKRNLVLKYTLSGTTGDAAAVKLVDVSALDANIGVNGLTLMSASWGMSGTSCQLFWDATTDIPIIMMPSDTSDVQDYAKFGGIKNNAGTGATGDVMFTTTGYTAAGDGGHMFLWFKKT